MVKVYDKCGSDELSYDERKRFKMGNKSQVKFRIEWMYRKGLVK